MSFQVFELRKARSDVAKIFEWIASQSPSGALKWLDSYDEAIEKLKLRADRFSLAEEDDDFEIEIRQAFFQTPRGKLYRIVFTIENQDAFVLRVRAPGQRDITPDDI